MSSYRRRGIAVILALSMLLSSVPAAFARSSENLALNRPATATSVYYDPDYTTEDFSPGNAFDGDESTLWATQDFVQSDYPDVLTVDLESRQVIDTIVLKSTDLHSSRTDTIAVSVSDDGINFRPWIEATDSGHQKEVTLDSTGKPEEARYICFSFVGSDKGLAYAEIEIYRNGTQEPVEPERFSVSFDADGAEGEVPVYEDQTENTRVKLPECTLEKDGFLFAGWLEGEQLYQPGDIYVMGAEPVTFTAYWEDLSTKKFVISFDGGDGAQTGTTMPSYEETAGSVIELPICSFIKNGYAFTVWSDGNRLYRAGDQYTVPTENVTLIAQWRLASEPENLALGATAVSTDEYDENYVAGHAVDGKADTLWATKESDTGIYSDVLTIDLGQAMALNVIQMDVPQSHATRMETYEIAISEDGNQFEPLGEAQEAANLRLVLEDAITARYLRFSFTGSKSGLAISEIRVFNDPTARPPQPNLMTGATAESEDQYIEEGGLYEGMFTAEKAVDGDHGTSWATRVQESEILITLPEVREFNQVVIHETPAYKFRVKSYEVYTSENGADWTLWSQRVRGDGITSMVEEPVQTQYIKVRVFGSGLNEGFNIDEILLHLDPKAVPSEEIRVPEPRPVDPDWIKPDPSTEPSVYQKRKADMKYGMFLCYSINTYFGEEWSTHRPLEQLTPESFVIPETFDAEQWVKAAWEGGMNYVLLVTKHHEGFCIWDSAYTEFDVANSGGQKIDVIDEVAKACQKYGLKLALYYSLWDTHWSQSHAYLSEYDKMIQYNDYMNNQIKELLDGRYGEVVELWLDGGWAQEPAERWELEMLYNNVKTLQPSCQVSTNWTITDDRGAPKSGGIGTQPEYQEENDPIRYFPSDFRLGDPLWTKPGDQDPKIFTYGGERYYLPFEATICMNNSWFAQDYNTPEAMKTAQYAVDAYNHFVEQGNTFVYNLAPRKDGLLADYEIERLYESARLLGIERGDADLEKSGDCVVEIRHVTTDGYIANVTEQIYGNAGEPYTTAVPDKMAELGYELTEIPENASGVFRDGEKIVVEYVYRDVAEQVPGPDVEEYNYALHAEATASSSYGTGYTPDMAVDGKTDTRWASQMEIDAADFTIRLPAPATVYRLEIEELVYQGVGQDCMATLDVEYLDGETWKAVPGAQPVEKNGQLRTVRFDPVTSDGFRLRITTRSETRYLNLVEVRLWGEAGSPLSLATGKSAWQSSTDGSASADLAVDANSDTQSATLEEENPWWQVDLGSVYPVGEITVTGLAGHGDFSVSVLDENENTVWQNRILRTAENGVHVCAAGIPGRYVRVTYNGSGALKLSEVAVFEAENIALHRPAEQSSVSNGGEAGRAVDGNTDGNYTSGSTTHTALEDQPWWQVDLGETCAVSYIRVFNRTDGPSDGEPITRLSNYTVSVLDENQQVVWSTVQKEPPLPSVLHYAGGAEGRYVRIQLNGTNYLSLSEVQVFESPFPRYEQSGVVVTGATNGAAESDPAALTDGNDQTWWSTGEMDSASAVIDLDLGHVYGLEELRVTPQLYEGQNIEHNDRPARFNLWVSEDGKTYQEAIHNGEIVYADYNDNSCKTIVLDGVLARYIRLEILEPTGRRPEGYQKISISEIDFTTVGTPRDFGTLNQKTIAELQEYILNGKELSDKNAFFYPRGDLTTSYRKMQAGEETRVAFVGGSITEMSGWRNMTVDFLREAFPENGKLSFVESGISSYDSTCHAFRLQKDVFSQGKIDLLFLEAAVNDEANGRTDEEIQLAFEGIIQQAYRNNPDMDIVILYFVDDMKIAEYAQTQTSHIIDVQDAVAEYYNISAINLSQHVIESMNRGEYDWNTFGGLHPAPFGHKIYTNRLSELLTAFWRAADASGAEPTEKVLPEKLLHDNAYAYGRTIDVNQAVESGRLQQLNGFQINPSWNPGDGVGTRGDFVNVPMLVGEKPGDSFRFQFSGTAFGLFVAAGPRSGVIEYSIDGGAYQRADLYTQWSSGLHIPWALMLEKNLSNTQHTVDVRIAEGARSTCVIRYFLVNEGGGCGHVALTAVAAVDATCTVPGNIAYWYCEDCGKYFADEAASQEITKEETEIAATGHTEEILPAKASTCTETGLTEGKKCSVCGEILVAQEVVPVTDHTPEVLPAKEATCTETGMTEGSKCSVCGKILVAQETVPARGHKAETISGKAPTCTETGLTEGSKCSVCGEILKAQEEIPALGHNFTDWAYNADQHWKTCSRCDAVDETSREAHKWVEDAERSGEKTVWYVCQCGAEKKGTRTTAVPAYVLKAEQVDGGKISPSSCAVNAGDTVEFSITPDSGYRIADVLVDGKSVGAVSEYTFKNVSGHHTITAQFTNGTAPVETVKGFTDVTVNDWFADAVEYVVDEGLMNGTSETTFSPKNATTRGMIVTILYRLAGSPEVESDGATWWSDARVWAMEEGVSDGTNMDKAITREQLATMLYRYAGSEEVEGDLSAFTDGASVSEWATDALIWATANEIVTGKTGNVLDPEAGATRAETAAMLMRYCELDK